MPVSILQISNLFNLLSNHFIDDFKSLKSILDTYVFIEFNSNKAFTITNLSALIEKNFEENDFLSCDENAIRFLDLVKKIIRNLSWISENRVF